MNFRGFGYVTRPEGKGANAWHSYNCGFCGKPTPGIVVACYEVEEGKINKWLMCSGCGNGSVLSYNGVVYPSAIPGQIIEGLPEAVDIAYNEARRCLSVNSYVAVEMLCRKILMHVACEKGAEEGKTFEFYINYLETLGYITPPIKKWVEIIRKQGNQATHKLQKSDLPFATGILNFTAQLLRIIYEMEFLAGEHLSNSTLAT